MRGLDPRIQARRFRFFDIVPTIFLMHWAITVTVHSIGSKKERFNKCTVTVNAAL
jgi:hypothetical protein